MGILERDPDETASTLQRWLATRDDVDDPEVRDVTGRPVRGHRAP